MRTAFHFFALVLLLGSVPLHAQTKLAPVLTPPAPYLFTGLESRSCSPSNPTGGKGTAHRAIRNGNNPDIPLGDGRTVHNVNIPAHQTFALADVGGRGMVRSIWLTLRHRTPENLRNYILRFHWDGNEHPSVLAPLGDFFGLSHGRAAHYATPYLGVSEGKGFYCFFPMPFEKGFRITLENDTDAETGQFFYQVNYTLGDNVTPAMGRFHAHFRRQTPPKGQNFVMLDVKDTPGVYVGAVMSALPLEKGTWREGDIRFFIDGDKDQATIVGTGWSDWFLSGWGLGVHQSLYAGSNYQVMHEEIGDKYFCNSYRFHVLDPIYFQRELRVEHTQMGSHKTPDRLSEVRSEDWSATVYWYQKLQKRPLPPLPGREERTRGIEIQEWEKKAKIPRTENSYYNGR
jgi:hypothetical protein